MKRIVDLWNRSPFSLDSMLNRKLSGLTDEERRIAFRALGSMVPPSYMTWNPLVRIQLHLETVAQLLWYSDVVVALLPTFRQLRPYEANPGESFARAIGWDSVDITLPNQIKYLLTGSCSGLDHRIDSMHGFIIQKALSVRNAGTDVLWFGRNRESILENLPLIAQEDEVTKERIEVLLGSRDENGSASLASGTL